MGECKYEDIKGFMAEPCWMCATRGGGYTEDCDNKCAYAYLLKERKRIMGMIRDWQNQLCEQNHEFQRKFQIQDGLEEWSI